MKGGLCLQGLSIAHADRRMLTDVSLDIPAGESVCLIGSSGGGKSLIAAAIAGLLPDCMVARGQVRLGTEERAASDQAGLRDLWHQHSCLLPQEPAMALAPLLRGTDQVALAPPRLSREAAFAWLARFGLDRRAARRIPAELSGGMAQRLLAALVARTSARVLVVDEPTKGLDPECRAELVSALAALRDAGRAVLVITHDLDVVTMLGGQLAVLEAGRIAEAGSTDSLLRQPRSAFLRACHAADPSSWKLRPRSPGGAGVAAGEALVIARGGRRLAGPLDVTLLEGQIRAVLGPSGVGKTTLADTLLGLVPPAAGRVAWFGGSLDTRRRRALRPRFQKLHQDPTTVFPARRTFGESFADLRLLPGSADSVAVIGQVLERLQVPRTLLGRRPGEVSGGEAQRLALARILVLRPAMLVADEPCSRLDMPVQAETMLLLRGLADETGLAVLLTSHDRRAAEAIADDIFELRRIRLNT
jgi:peptide/nickel transport system ATP-binding protein